MPYFITCLAHQLSTTLWAHRTCHTSSHVWHTNYPPHYGYMEHTIFHLCYEMCMTYGISCKETYMKYDSKSHAHFLHFFSAGKMSFHPVLSRSHEDYRLAVLDQSHNLPCGLYVTRSALPSSVCSYGCGNANESCKNINATIYCSTVAAQQKLEWSS